MKNVICENYEEDNCPVGPCTFYECKDFKPTEYFLSGIRDLREVEECEECYCETRRTMTEDRD